MPALNFQARFAALVASGKKKQTIRATRKRPIKAGDTLYLFSGQRTKHSRRLAVGICTETFPVVIAYGQRIGKDLVTSRMPQICGVGECGTYYLHDADQSDIARRDGFNGVDDLVDWFEETHGLPFLGQVIRWKLKGKQCRSN